MNTKEKIILGAVQLFVEQGVAETTTREIALRAGVAEGSLYRYFPGKEELAWQIFQDYHQNLAECLAASVLGKESMREQVHSLVASFFQLADEDWLMFRYYLTGQHMFMHKIDHGKKNPYQVITSLINRSVDGVLNEDIKITAAMAMGAVHQVALNKLYGRIEGNLSIHVNKVAEIVYQILANTNKPEIQK